MAGRIAASIVVMLFLLGSAMAQDPEPIEPVEQEPDPRDVGRPAAEETARSVIDGLTMSRRSRFGVSLGAYEAYSTNLYATQEGKQGSGITMLSPRVFFNHGSRRSRFHADYGYGYRFYNRFGDLNTDSHDLNLDYYYRLTRRVNFFAYERLDDAVNDAYSSFSPGFAFTGGPLLSGPQEFMRARQKIFRNDTAIGLGFQVTRRGFLSLTSGYQTWRYHIERYANMSSAYASIRYAHQIKRWLNISTSYTTYFADMSSQYSDRQIHRLQAGDFTLQLTRKWAASLSGGVDYARGGAYHRRPVATGSGSASLSHATSTNEFSIRYHRGLSTYFGVDGLYASSYGLMSFLQRLSRRVSTQAQGYYHWGSEYGGGRQIQYYGGTVGFQYGLRADLVASANYMYRNQRFTGPSYTPWNFDRSVVYGGLTWFWPTQ